MQRWNDISAKNALVADGKPPFHLKVDFRLFDLEGHPGQNGTVEEWWTPDKGFRAEINSPLEHVVYPGENSLQSDGARRENYLALEMLGSFEHPMAHLRLDRPRNIFTDARKDGEVKMVCYQAGPASATSPNWQGSFVCVNPVTNSVRQVPQAGETLARNTIATFHDSLVALDIRIAYNDRPAIEGHVSLLRDFDASRASVELVDPNASKASKSETAQPVTVQGSTDNGTIASTPPSGTSLLAEGRVRVASNAIAARLVKAIYAEYPQAARQYHLTGTVLLHVTVSPQGTVESVFPIASPSPLLTAPAERAVEQWVYKPWELNAKPVTVDTTVTVNFQQR